MIVKNVFKVMKKKKLTKKILYNFFCLMKN